MLVDKDILETIRRVLISFLNLLDSVLEEVPSIPSREERDWLYRYFHNNGTIDAIPDNCVWLMKHVARK